MADQIDALIRLRRGPDSERQTKTFDSGEIVFSTDNKKTFIGDGSTVGGIVVGNHNTIGTSPSPYAIQNDLYFNKSTNIMYMLSSSAGADNIANYARITPVADNLSLLYENGALKINNYYFNDPDTGFLRLSGGTLVGYLTLNADPIGRNHAATKGYTDTRLSSLSAAFDSKVSELFGNTDTGTLEVQQKLTVTGSMELGSTLTVANSARFGGDVDFRDHKILRFSVKVKNVSLTTQNDTYIVQPEDNGSVLYVDSSDVCYVAMPNDLPIGFNLLVLKKSLYSLTFKAAASFNAAKILNVYNYITINNRYGMCNILSVDADVFIISGDLS